MESVAVCLQEQLVVTWILEELVVETPSIRGGFNDNSEAGQSPVQVDLQCTYKRLDIKLALRETQFKWDEANRNMVRLEVDNVFTAIRTQLLSSFTNEAFYQSRLVVQRTFEDHRVVLRLGL